MQITTEKRTRFSEEVRLVPGWALMLAAISFVAMQFVFNLVLAHQKNAPPAWGRAAMGVAAGIVFGAYVLLLGYINRDAGRRGMSRWLWTVIAVLVPNGFGIILYFILRQPLLTVCPQCGTHVETGFNYCPKCATKLNPSCPHCQKSVRPGSDYCAYCGGPLQETKQSLST
jgi:quinol-cytochrome oxidoreductase complex cytochrome b subunit